MIKQVIIVINSIIVLCNVSCNSRIDDKKIVEYVDNNDYNKVEKWIKNGGNPNLILPDSSTLLYIATGPHGGFEVTKILVKSGARIDKGQGKYTPLMNAASWCNYDIVEFLLENNANPNLKNEMNQTALQEVGDCNNCPAEIRTKSLLTKVTIKN